jgi:hypothetical protein
MGLILVISSLKRYQYPYQATGYKCSKYETEICTITSSPTAKNTITTKALCSVNCINSTTSATTTTTTTTSLCYQGSCATGWKLYQGSCYKSIVFQQSGGVEKLDSTLIQAKCGRTGSTAANTEFKSVDITWLNMCMCPASTDTGNDGIIFFDPSIGRSGSQCPSFDCISTKVGDSHDCNHGEDPLTKTQHAIFVNTFKHSSLLMYSLEPNQRS